MPHAIVRLSTVSLLTLALSVPAFAQSENVPPAAVETEDIERVFIDTQVADVYIDIEKTVAIMGQSPESRCPSNEYVFERERPKWLFETGRLLVAQEEAATIRVSFTCFGGFQSINAIQFLSPPVGRVVSGTPSRDRAIRTTTTVLPSATRPAGVPLPRPTSALSPLPRGDVAEDEVLRTFPAAGASASPVPSTAQPIPLPTTDAAGRPLASEEQVRRIPLP